VRCNASAQRIAERWHEARSKGGPHPIEGQEDFEGLERFLTTVETLNKERRLLHNIYLAQKPGTNERPCASARHKRIGAFRSS
jgi:hypothetical protein